MEYPIPNMIFNPTAYFEHGQDVTVFKGQDYCIIHKVSEEEDTMNRLAIVNIELEEHSSKAIESIMREMNLHGLIEQGDKLIFMTVNDIVDGNALIGTSIPDGQNIKVLTPLYIGIH